MEIHPTACEGLYIIAPERHGDERGFIMEVYRRDRFAERGIPTDFVQQNHSRSVHGVLRGLHFQWDPLLGKLIRVIRGKALSVAVDIRVGSPTFGKHVLQELSDDNALEVWAPPGFATGFYVSGDAAEVEYHYSAYYNPRGESSILWRDPEIGIDWGADDPILSDRDRDAQTLAQWLARPESRFFKI